MLGKTIVPAAFVGIASLLATPAMGNASACVAVYSNAVANVEIETRERSERSYVYNLYCEQNGEMRSTAGGGSLSFPIKGIPISLSAEGSFSQSQLREFCRIGNEQDFFHGSDFGFGRYVSEAALRSFNDCVALEREGMTVTHQVAAPEAFSVYLEFRDSRLNGTLDLVDYDEEKMTCTSAAFTKDGEAETLYGSMRREIGNGRSFTIGCRRTPQISTLGRTFPQAEFLLSTSWGPYRVSLPGDTHYGFELASHASATHAEVIERLREAQGVRDREARRAADAEARAAVADRRLSGLRIFTVYQGDNFSVEGDFKELCTTLGGAPVNNREYMEARCRIHQMAYQSHRRVRVHSGGHCGHASFALVCSPN